LDNLIVEAMHGKGIHMKNRVFFIEGDGVGPEIWAAARPIIDAAVQTCYADGRSIEWVELLAGEKALRETGEYLPQETMTALKKAVFAMKGPLTTPVGSGFRSLNVTMRQGLDLYACIRPVRYFQGIESPVKHPERVDMIIFRENTEDVYAGIEWESGSDEVKKLIGFLRDVLGVDLDATSGVGIKPMTPNGSKRLVRRAIQYALDQGRKSVTLVHKGNIMKYTEGAFRKWGYELAAEEFGELIHTEGEPAAGRPLEIKDRIADAMFQEVLMRPAQYDVIATTNLNGDYISDALAAQVGGLGLAPGVNMGDTLALFEPTHGTAPTIAGKDMANPGSLILSGAMLLDHMGWNEAGDRIRQAVERVITDKRVTVDLAGQIQGATQVACSAFGELVGQALAIR
jgi:isocitrate dehydrogenase